MLISAVLIITGLQLSLGLSFKFPAINILKRNDFVENTDNIDENINIFKFDEQLLNSNSILSRVKSRLDIFQNENKLDKISGASECKMWVQKTLSSICAFSNSLDPIDNNGKTKYETIESMKTLLAIEFTRCEIMLGNDKLPNHCDLTNIIFITNKEQSCGSYMIESLKDLSNYIDSSSDYEKCKRKSPLEGIQINKIGVSKCVDSILHHTSQTWTSFSGNYRDVATSCAVIEYGNHKDFLVGLHADIMEYHLILRDLQKKDIEKTRSNIKNTDHELDILLSRIKDMEQNNIKYREKIDNNLQENIEMFDKYMLKFKRWIIAKEDDSIIDSEPESLNILLKKSLIDNMDSIMTNIVLGNLELNLFPKINDLITNLDMSSNSVNDFKINMKKISDDTESNFKEMTNNLFVSMERKVGQLTDNVATRVDTIITRVYSTSLWSLTFIMCLLITPIVIYIFSFFIVIIKWLYTILTFSYKLISKIFSSNRNETLYKDDVYADKINRNVINHSWDTYIENDENTVDDPDYQYTESNDFSSDTISIDSEINDFD